MFSISFALLITVFGSQSNAKDLEPDLKEALRSLQAAESMPSPDCRTTLNRVLPAGYIEIAPDGKIISRTDVVGPQSTLCSGRASTIEDERIHLFRDETGLNRTAVVTYRTKQRDGATYSQNLYVFSKRSAWVPLVGREMPVTTNNQLSITIDPKAQEATLDIGSGADVDQLHKWVELSQWASVPSAPGSDEERQKEKARLSMMPSDYIRITRTGNFMTRDEALGGGVDQGDVQTITYDNVRIAILSDIAIVTYRSTYKSSARTQYNLLMRVFALRHGTWEEIAGQGFPIPRPPQ
jgi:hypothetical protein